MAGKKYLGIDIGGTAVKIGIVDETGEVLRQGEASVCFDAYRTPIIETVVSTVHRLLAAWHTGTEDLEGIGCSATGQVNCNTGVVVGTCGNLPGWTGTDLKGRLEKEFGLPAQVQNDANCMLLGEAWKGGARGKSDVLGFTIGTGIGGGILTGGRLLTGKNGLGGEIGHMHVHAIDGIFCTCGSRGCWESYASTTALVREAKKIDPSWDNGRIFFEKAEEGDERAVALLERWIREISAGIESLVHLLNPELVLIGGGVSAQKKLLIEPLAKRVKENVMPAFAENLEVREAELGNTAGLVGAVAWYISVEE